MSAEAFALTSPSLTDMSDAINRQDARHELYAAEQAGDAALAAWARKYGATLLEFGDDAEDTIDRLDAIAEWQP